LIFGLALNVGEGLDEAAAIASLLAGSKISRVWVSYSLRGRDPFEVASAAAEANRDLRIGLGALSPYIYAPQDIKRKMFELIGKHGERFDLCLGLGDRKMLEFFGLKISHNTFLTLLTYTLRAIKDDLSERGVKIWLGAQGSKTIALAEHFDGVLLNHCNPDAVRWALEKMDSVKNRIAVGISAPAYIYEHPDGAMLASVRKAALKMLLGSTKMLARELNLQAEYDLALRSIGGVEQDDVSFVSEGLIKTLTITMHINDLPDYIRSIRELGVVEVVFGYPLSLNSSLIKMLRSALEKIP